MNATIHRQPEHARLVRKKRPFFLVGRAASLSYEEERPPTTRHRRYLAIFLLVAGYLLFCHGCHGDEDNELFARLKAAEFPLVTD